MSLARSLEESERPSQLVQRRRGVAARVRHHAGALSQRRLLERLDCEIGGTFEIAHGLLARGERGRPFAGTGEHRARLGADLGRVLVLGCGTRSPRRSATATTSAISCSAGPQPPPGGRRRRDAAACGPARERLVRDLAEQVLEEGVLPALRRPRIRLQREHLLPHERAQQRLELAPRPSRQRGERLLREALAEHGRVLKEASLLRVEPVQPRGDERVQRLRDLERLDRPGRPVVRPLSRSSRPRSSSIRTVSTAYSGTPSARSRICARSSPGSPGPAPSRSSSIACRRGARGRARCSSAAGHPSSGGAPERSGRREREHEDRMAARPLEQVFDEVEQGRSAHCMSSKTMTTGWCSLSRSKKRRHAANRSSRSAVKSLFEPEQVRQPRLDPVELVRVGDVRLDGLAQLRPRRLRVLALDDVGARPHHLGERPVRHAFAVRQAAAAPPPDCRREAVDVLVELPRQPRLAEAGDADDRDEMRLPLLAEA